VYRLPAAILLAKVNVEPIAPEPEKVQLQPAKGLKSLGKAIDKVVTTKERKNKGDTPVSLSVEGGATAPGDGAISPEVMRKFGLRYNVGEWPPKRRED
jgi:hypothetical protein